MLVTTRILLLSALISAATLISIGTTTIAVNAQALDEYDYEPGDEPNPAYDICADPKLKSNRVIQENYCTPAGVSNSSIWDINGFGDPSIQGFSTDISYNAGATARFKIDSSSAASYRVDIFRMGYYGGAGGRKVASVRPSVSLPFEQPACVTDPDTLEYSCTAWKITAEWKIPSHALSGVYIARPTRTDDAAPKTWRADNSQFAGDPLFAIKGHEGEEPTTGPQKYGANGMGDLREPIREPQASHIYFVVRNDDSKADIVMQTADTVWQAYNTMGGTSTYGSFKPEDPKPRCYVASLDRPLRTRELRSVNAFFGSEFPMVQFLEKHGYDVTYISGVDTDRFGRERLLRHKIFFSVGHDEYWSGPQRSNVEHARDSGVNLAFFSGNDMFWRVRWEPNQEGDSYRRMMIYKETQHPEKLDPNMTEWTGTWRDARPFNPVGSKPENAVIGQIFTMNAWRNDPLIVPRRFSNMRWWRNTDVEKMSGFLNGRRLKNTSEEVRRLTNWRRTKHVAYFRGILGHEMDEDVDNGFRPPSVIHLSETHVDNVMYVQDYGSTYDSGHGVHRLTLYKSEKSGAMVFGAGTCQWSWALAPLHDGETQLPSIRMNYLNVRVGEDVFAPVRDIVQFTVTLLDGMAGAKPVAETLHGTGGVRVLDIPKDTKAPECRVESVHLHMDGGKRITFPDSPDGEPEDAIVIRAKAVDHGGGIVAGMEVLLDRWYFMLPTDSPATPLRHEDGEETAWAVTAPLRKVAKELLDANRITDLLEMVYCRATDDSLNTGAPYRLHEKFKEGAEETKKRDLEREAEEAAMSGEN